jgi:hypothetical protein
MEIPVHQFLQYTEESDDEQEAETEINTNEIKWCMVGSIGLGVAGWGCRL